MDQKTVIDATRRWVSSMVIGLNLCPFAGRAFAADKIRYTVSAAEDEEELYQDLAREVEALVACPVSGIETTLLIHPHVLGSYIDYNDFLNTGERLIAKLGHRSKLQLAGFHPDYRFEGVDADAVENYTNRSPYPMLHLLREASISAVASDPVGLLEIPRRNIETLRRLGLETVQERLKAIKEETTLRPSSP